MQFFTFVTIHADTATTTLKLYTAGLRSNRYPTGVQLATTFQSLIIVALIPPSALRGHESFVIPGATLNVCLRISVVHNSTVAGAVANTTAQSKSSVYWSKVFVMNFARCNKSKIDIVPIPNSLDALRGQLNPRLWDGADPRGISRPSWWWGIFLSWMRERSSY